MKSILFAFSILAILFVAACSPKESTDTQESAPVAEAPQEVEKVRTQLTITPTSFRGITIGDKIASHSDYAVKDLLKNGEGDFDIYTIKDFNNNPAGYIMSDPRDESLVGTITITTQMAATAKGVKVGMTWSQLQNVFPDVEVHGSEIEGRTYASSNGINCLLNVPNFSYDVDVAKIPAEAKVVEILVMGE